MSGDRFLLLFPAHGEGRGGWLRVEGEAVVARGIGLAGIPPRDDAVTERIVLIAPGEAVSLHWIELPGLAPDQARAAARIMAAEVTAEPLDRVHVAVGAGDGALRPMALVATGAMATWLGTAQGLALDPDHVVPEPLLIPVADADAADAPVPEIHWLRDDGMVVVRGAATAHVATPAVAALVADGAPHAIDDAAFERGIARALAALPLDLRQGMFARRRRWTLDRALVRRLARQVAAILIVTLLVQLVLIARYRIEAARQDRAAEAAAAAALPRESRIVDADAQLRERMARLRGGGLGFSATAGLLFGAVRETAGVELGALAFAPDGTLTATISAPGPAELDAVVQRLGAAGLAASAGEPRMAGGRVLAELTMRAP